MENNVLNIFTKEKTEGNGHPLGRLKKWLSGWNKKHFRKKEKRSKIGK